MAGYFVVRPASTDVVSLIPRPGEALAVVTDCAAREYRLAPSGRIKERLGLSVYDRESVFEPDLLHPSEVRILLKQHVGAPSVPVVEEGQTVATGECIAVPPEGALGAKIHASVDGSVVSVTSGMVVLRRRE